MTKEKHLINTIHIPIRWEDLDAYNHVGNQRYFSYMTEARAQVLKLYTGSLKKHLYILVDTRCNFKTSFTYPGNVVLHQYLIAFGNASFELAYIFEEKDTPGKVYAEGYAKMVCVDAATQKPVRVPDDLREYLGAPSN